MILDVKIGEEFVNKKNGATYVAYRVHGRGKGKAPGSEEVTIFLRFQTATWYSFFPNELIAVPEQDMNEFFTSK